MLERGGRVRTWAIKPISKRIVQRTLKGNLDATRSHLITDEHPFYYGIGDHIPHDSVMHAQTYVTGDGTIHTQGIENFWSLLKRGLIGTYHHVGSDFLNQYLGEFTFRFNARKISDRERFDHALRNVNGRLIWYFDPSQASEPEPTS